MEQFEIFYRCNGISSDTRKITENSLFICIKGDNFNGNKFASEALEKGAKHVIVDDPEFYTPGDMTLVENSLIYLQRLANYHRKKFNIPVIGITGSNGKTTTKELIQAVLSKKYNTLATIGNLNNHLGVPFTLLRLTDNHEIAIIEMGANRFKDIEELCVIAEPSHGIITNIGKAHLEGFGSFEGVLKTKSELYTAVKQNEGTIFYNSDDEILSDVIPENIETVSYGKNEKAELSGELIRLTPFVEMRWKFKNYTSPACETKLIGEYNFYNFLAAITIGNYFKVEKDDINAAIQEYTPTNQRSQINKTEYNTLILDCYNANPTSMALAIKSLAQNQNNLEKLIIAGEMKELGGESIQEHQKIVELIDELGINAIYVGDGFKGQNNWFPNTTSLIHEIESNRPKDKLILLKGSRSVGLEKLEEYL
jgi:UDP-N-acetylmuramoyl-tripeptide--D-alanyl-D-alanine ligase